MKLDIDRTITPQAAGEPRAEVAIIAADEARKQPAAVAVLMLGQGQTVRVVLTGAEARAFGELLITCGCVAEGGMPPVVAPTPPSPLIIHSGGRA